MNTAVRKAKEIYKQYGNDVYSIASSLGLDIIDVPMEGEAKEIFWGDIITLREGLEELLRRELIAHAICHFLLHSGSHYALHSRKYSYGNYHEKQANVFAAFLLMPDEELEEFSDQDLSIYDLAGKFNVTPQFVKFRLGLAKHYSPKKFSSLWR